MLFQLQLLAYRLIKPLMKPVSRLVAIPRPVLFVGPGSTTRLCQLIAGSGSRRTLIVTDAVLVKLGLIEPVRKALEAEGVDVAVFDGIVPGSDPRRARNGASWPSVPTAATRSSRSVVVRRSTRPR